MANSNVYVTHIEWEWDMRSKLPLLNHHRARRLKLGECFIAFNRRCSMARIVDGVGGFHEFRADTGEAFDVNAIVDLMRKGWYVPLELGAKVIELKPPDRKKKKAKRADPKKAPRRSRRVA